MSDEMWMRPRAPVVSIRAAMFILCTTWEEIDVRSDRNITGAHKGRRIFVYSRVSKKLEPAVLATENATCNGTTMQSNAESKIRSVRAKRGL